VSLNLNNFDGATPGLPCAVCEAMCLDAVDGTLTAAEQHAFDKHVAGCTVCSAELAEAHRGAAWMHMLKGHTPEPPAALLEKILAQTSGLQTSRSTAYTSNAAAVPASFAGASIAESSIAEALPQAAKPGMFGAVSAKLRGVFAMPSMMLQPRLAMTAAMAFFSVALTLNMAGVRLTDLRASMLRPSSIERSVADASASSIRSFQNLRVVYEFESRMNDMRSDGALGDRYERNGQDPGSPFTGSQQNDNQPDAQPKPQGTTPARPGTVAEKGA
jgi:anti-sigma factor RsiW